MKFEKALINHTGKGYYLDKRTNTYKCVISDKGKDVNLGRFTNINDALQCVLKFKSERLLNSIRSNGLNENNGEIYKSKYICFPSGEIFDLTGRRLYGYQNEQGYYKVHIDGKIEFIHRIIAKVFIPNPNNYEVVNHKDGNVLNNDVNNLEWCTQADNVLHAYKNNLVKHKLNNEQVLYIKKHYIPYDENFGARVLGKRFGISEDMVSEIANGKRWKWLNEN